MRPTPANNGDQLIVQFESLTQAGQAIIDNATTLDTQIQRDWNAFDATYKSMPPYFVQLFSDYQTARKKELANMVQHRKEVGQLLQKASNLFQFNEQAAQTVFKNMKMGVSTTNTSSTNLTPPDGWTH